MDTNRGASSDLTEKIRHRIRDFLASEPEVSAFGQDLSKIGEVAVFGGVPRDLARGTDVRPETDVDLVVDCAHDTLERHLRHRQPLKNKFNGFRILVGQRSCDVWAAQETWAVKQGYRELRCLNDLAMTTFFSCDQILYNISKDYVHATDAFLKWHAQQVVTLNLANNPNNDGIISRIVRILNEWEHAVDRDIVRFFTETIEHRLTAERQAALPEIWDIIYRQAKDFENRPNTPFFSIGPLTTQRSEPLELPASSHINATKSRKRAKVLKPGRFL